MLILGAIFNCLDPIMTVVAGLSVRDPFLMPADKKDLAESAKAQFSARDYSDHLALVRAYEGWKEAEAQQAGYEYCWQNFLSSQTLRAIDSLRKQFCYLLKDIGLVDHNSETYSRWSHEEHLVRAVICAGLFPGVSSVVDGHLKMLGGYLEFFMKPELANTYLRLKGELEELIQKKLLNRMTSFFQLLDW
ncbi:DExH-box ATP-dependent RNA helicase DExH3-like [Arachis ipaensis]|uniref:DExH-box ATP-dependent RNA helicase DExH3-like n=1 Tax=Arachis ipaensis TaxID=130454 RepID=UPI0007AFCC7C|nr:DExH-box ATP-dependent RNA helicase DExH3-like [Arachis ipaensis]QHO05760.1 Putative ATP-dependent RNA helicase [Arachis hypogaea]